MFDGSVYFAADYPSGSSDEMEAILTGSNRFDDN
jgi:hypothetical protein